MTEKAYRNYCIKLLRGLADRIERGHHTFYKKSNGGQAEFTHKKIITMADLVIFSIKDTAQRIKK